MKEAENVVFIKEKVKEMFEKTNHLRKQLGTIVNLPSKHTIVDQSLISSERKFRSFKWSSEKN